MHVGNRDKSDTTTRDSACERRRRRLINAELLFQGGKKHPWNFMLIPLLSFRFDSSEKSETQKKCTELCFFHPEPHILKVGSYIWDRSSRATTAITTSGEIKALFAFFSLSLVFLLCHPQCQESKGEAHPLLEISEEEAPRLMKNVLFSFLRHFLVIGSFVSSSSSLWVINWACVKRETKAA